ncbi:fructosamine kinase family protein [Danxiaibacter flavus]|uniref:Fructosamine kinase family protein n=1 Tax=Danxiaibacter flavus TaxID=3049108 RepID=A0ABV3Z8D5_9BACT|nr:fructosamine kinase family protein [Chitinophagaceae bacterium DXS]
MRQIFSNIVQQLNAQRGIQITSFDAKRVYGGDINETYRLTTNKGDFFVKLNDSVHGDMFKMELESLRLLKNASNDLFPQAILAGNTPESIFLVLEFLEKGNITPASWRNFAQQLAALHTQTHNRYGLSFDNYIGSLQQHNTFETTWHEFYAKHRILFLVRMAIDQAKLDSKDALLAEKLCLRLPEIFPQEKPALLHGDLWSGNFMISTTGDIKIFDPAIYYGHREMDIAMTMLFGGFDRSFYNHYNDFYPLEQNWQQRIDLCQLYPLLVHCILFGGHYVSAVRSIIRKYA